MNSGMKSHASPDRAGQAAESPPADYGSHPGTGDWKTFPADGLETIHLSASHWAEKLRGVDKPWLCWHVNRRWCLLQQRVIQEFGWTPVVGGDPRFGEPILLPGSVYVDFNELFRYPIMLPLFPLEFVFLFADRLAFMHSDLLCRLRVMEGVVHVFEGLRDGEMAAPYTTGGRRYLLQRKRHVYWDLMTCTTRGASESQFRFGSGWWKHFAYHPNCPDDRERGRRAGYYYDFGAGIAFWKRKCGGAVIDLELKPLKEGHCTAIGNKDYKYIGTVRNRALDREIDLNYPLGEVATRFGLEKYLDEVDEYLNDSGMST